MENSTANNGNPYFRQPGYGEQWSSATVEDITGIFSSAQLTGGAGNNTMVVNAIDGRIVANGSTRTVTTWNGDAVLDNGGNTSGVALPEYYVITIVPGSTMGVDIVDSGGGSGTDDLVVFGSNQADNLTLGAAGQGAFAVGFIESTVTSTTMLSFQGVERLEIYALGGNDNVLSNDTAVTTVIDMGSGDDSLVVGTVPLIPDPGNRTLEYPNGVPVADVAHMTNGNTAPLYVLGGTQNDSFEVDHNVGMLYLAGDEGDDTFLINTFLVLKQNPDKPDLVTNLTTLFGGTGSNRYQYLQNAPVFINGGSGYDTLIIVGTPIDDTFIVTDTYIAGAGRLVNFTNIEAIEVDGAGGNDSIYVMSTDPDLTVTVNGGPGDDVIHIGGTPPPLVYAPPPFTYTPPAYTVTSLQVVMTTVTNNYTTYTFHEDLFTWAAIGGTGNAQAAATLLLDQAFGITPGGTTTATFNGLSVSYDWNIFDFFDLLPSVTVTLSGVQVSYQVPTIRIFQRQIQPPPVTITPAPVALMAPPSLDASLVKSRVIILGGNDFETNGDTVVYENENGARADVGQLVQRTTPRIVEVGEKTDGTPIFAQDTLGGVGLTDTYLSLESTGLGISPAGTMSVEKTPYFGLQMQGIEHIQLHLSNADDTFLIADNGGCTGTDPAQTCSPDAGTLPPTLDVYGDDGNDTFMIGGIGAATTVFGGGGTDSITVNSPSADLSGILGRLTVDGDDLSPPRRRRDARHRSGADRPAVPDDAAPRHPDDPERHRPRRPAVYEAAWVRILCVDTATATGTFCHDSGSSALVGSVEVRSAVIDGQGNLTTVDVQQKGSLVYAQQEYGYQDFETLTLPVYRFSLGLFGFFVDHITIDVPLSSPRRDLDDRQTGMQKIVTATFGTTSPASAVPLYLDDAGNETTSNTGIPVMSRRHVRRRPAGPPQGVRRPELQRAGGVGPEPVSDSDFS